MKIGVNLIAGIASAGWSALLGFLVIPFYLRWLGVEAYGLVGFFVTLQGVFALVDLGMTPLITREVARSRVTPGAQEPGTLLHSIAVIYWGMAALILVVLIGLSGPIAKNWLNTATLDPLTVQYAVALMAIVVSCRVPLGIYNGALMGAERITLVSLLSAAMVTLANAGAVLVLLFVSPTIKAFFAWQAVVAGLQLLLTRQLAWRTVGGRTNARFDWSDLKRVRRFSAGMGATVILGIMFSQADKVVLSRLVPLADLGVYSLAWVLTRVLYLFVTPTFNVAYPRMSALHSAGDEAALASFYRTGTRLLLAVVLPLALFLASFGGEVVTGWTGDAATGARIVPIMWFVMIGTGLNAIMYFPYTLQLACGRADLSALISGAMLVLYLPLLIGFTLTYGTLGGAVAWAAYNGMYVLAGTWITHRTLLTGIGRRWLMTDVGLPAGVAIVIVVGLGWLVRLAGLPLLVELAAGGLLTVTACAVTIMLSPSLLLLVTGGLKRLSTSGSTI